MITAERARELLAAATPGPREVYDPNEGMWPPRPLWCVANAEFHDAAAAEDDERPWLAFNAYVETGVRADADLIAAAPDLAQTVIDLSAQIAEARRALRFMDVAGVQTALGGDQR